jgi:hypothetical protein
VKKLSRRKILEAGVFGSIAMSGAGAARLSFAFGGSQTGDQKSASRVFDARQRDLLRMAMDEIIPAADGMPAASEANGVDYLENLAGRDAKAAKELQESLTALETLSQKRTQTSFLLLSHKKRMDALVLLERQKPDYFNVLRDSVYEAYYEQPQVWKLIGYQYYPTNGGGPVPEPFDEQILADVRKKPKHYREV